MPSVDPDGCQKALSHFPLRMAKGTLDLTRVSGGFLAQISIVSRIGMLEVVHKLERPSEGAITGADQRGPKKELSNELARQSTKGGSHDLAQWFLMARRSLEMAGGGTPAAATRADPPIEKREKNCETR
ncbi:hypothetical protein CRG98_005927 [Punica granatum]|uniref:Uncharacterized protein n=1 Tax=Punica granatum TaxID=22663 RepID=A0A2I0L0P2_PUNGR|nr:hypothetical protein CRG98_005927 [Punica granatum]